MLKVGIIGAGRMGKAHAGNLAKLQSVKLTAVYDINPAQSAAMKENYPTMEIRNSAAELVNDPEVELIVIASPTYCHKEGILAAMATGKPIFCEKPLCRTKEDFKELTPLIKGYKNLFAIGFVRRYSAAVITMRNLIAQGKIGKPICSSVTCLFGGFKREWGDWFADYDKSGGVMLDMLAHHCDLQNLFLGKPVSVYAQAFRMPKDQEKPQDYVSATAVYEGNCICNLECSWIRAGVSDTFMTIHGEKGALKFSDSQGVTFYDIGGAESKIEIDEGVKGHLQEEISGNMYAQEMATIVDCVLNNKAPLAGADAAVEAMTFCLGMMESAETGDVVRF
ncbi:MAG: Gfo/Idh/MocA family oxidoreductase [Lentisphaerae bacterium]|nr:Gfo/Idh/MocA family oxidoreductase [Lentisphaerota bacterium]